MPIVLLPDEDVYGIRKKIQFFLDRLESFENKLGRPARILDFGCGNAEQLGKFVVGAGRSYVGVDFHNPSLDHARSICAGEGATFVSAVPTDQEFDVILVSEVLEHLDDPVDVLKSLASQLTENGIVIGSIPNGYGLTEIEKYVDRKLGLYKGLRYLVRSVRKMRGQARPDQEVSVPYNNESGHVQFFTKRELRRVARAAGLDTVDFSHGSIMGADLSAVTILRPRILVEWNTRLANYVPSWAAATWHFVLTRDERHD